MGQHERAFRGVWIPAALWLSRDITLQEKVLLVEIDSLQHATRGCFKTNKRMAEFFGLSPNRISELVGSLGKKGWISVKYVRQGKQIVERQIFMLRPLGSLDEPLGSLDGSLSSADEPFNLPHDAGYSENRVRGNRYYEGRYSESKEKGSRYHETGYSENREERGSGSRGSKEGIEPGATPPVPADDSLKRDEPWMDIPANMPGPKDQHAKTFKPWAHYAVTYRDRYGEYPIWNQRVAGQLSQLVDRVSHELAPRVAAYYLSMNNQFYIAKGHPVGLMLQDCEDIATQMRTGNQMTVTRARQIDGTQANLGAINEAKAMLRASWGDA